MTIIGVRFDLQQEEDFRLMNVLEDVIDPTWYWRFGGGENYIRNANGGLLDSQVFTYNRDLYSGDEFIEVSQTPNQYIIFADLKAFPSNEQVKKVLSYDEFLKSDCQFTAIIVDAAYIMLISKDVETIIEKTKHRPNFHFVYRDELSHLTI